MLSIILPTYNEAGNLAELFQRISTVMGKRSFEIIVVDDDSPDRTSKVATDLSHRFPAVRVLQRIGRRGLSSAVVEGFAMARGDILLVMDADLQHDPQLALTLAEKIETGSDIAVASRYTEGGSVGDWVTGRRLLSKTATFLARHLPRVKVTDPMSGFFAIRKSAYDRIARKLRPTGFKILLEVLAHLPRKTKVSEVPLHFQQRLSGESKLSLHVELQFMMQLFRIFLKRMHLWVFGVIAFIILIVLLVNIRRLQLLYVNSVVRNNIQTTMRRAADEQGWLISDMSISSVASEYVDVDVRSHHRGEDEEECYRLYYNASPLRPCSDF